MTGSDVMWLGQTLLYQVAKDPDQDRTGRNRDGNYGRIDAAFFSGDWHLSGYRTVDCLILPALVSCTVLSALASGIVLFSLSALVPCLELSELGIAVFCAAQIVSAAFTGHSSIYHLQLCAAHGAFAFFACHNHPPG